MGPKITFSLNEISMTSGIGEETILQYIEEEWILPYSSESCTFDSEDLARLLLIRELMERLGVNQESVPIILHLIDQLHVYHQVIKARS